MFTLLLDPFYKFTMFVYFRMRPNHTGNANISDCFMSFIK